MMLDREREYVYGRVIMWYLIQGKLAILADRQKIRTRQTEV